MVSAAVVAGAWLAVATLTTAARISWRCEKTATGRLFNCLALCFFTLQAGSSIEIARKLAELQTPTIIKSNLDDILQQSRVIAKQFIAFFEGRVCALWLVKGCLLTLDYRITNMVALQRTFINIIIVYVFASFLTLQVCFFFVWCRPFRERWGNMQGQCGIPSHNEILDAVLNISSDVAMIAVVVPMLARTSLPRRQKIFVCSLFLLSGIVIGCAVAGKYYAFTKPTSVDGMSYFLRETGMAILVANVSVSAPSLRKIGHALGRYWKTCKTVTTSKLSTMQRATTSSFSKMEEDTSLSQEITVCTTIEMSYMDAYTQAKEDYWNTESESRTRSQEKDLVAPWSKHDIEQGVREI